MILPTFEDFVNEKRGLWDNVHAKRKRGEKPAKPGDEDYPDEEAWKAAQENLDENSTSTYSRGCAMLYFDFPIEELHKQINEEDIYTEEGDNTYGLEDEPHITLLYGLDEDVTPDQIKEITDKIVWGDKIILRNASLFESDKYDVLKFDTRYPTKGGAFMHNCNRELSKLPHKNDYPDYHPHSTIAYLKKGMGKKYVESLKGLEYEVKPNHVIYSAPDGTKTKIDINK